MTETLAEFRHFYFKTEFPESICDQLDNGSQCPACFSVSMRGSTSFDINLCPKKYLKHKLYVN